MGGGRVHGEKLSECHTGRTSKLCTGIQKAWPDGKESSTGFRSRVIPRCAWRGRSIFGRLRRRPKAAIAKLKRVSHDSTVVASDEDLLHLVETTPGAVGISTSIPSTFGDSPPRRWHAAPLTRVRHKRTLLDCRRASLEHFSRPSPEPTGTRHKLSFANQDLDIIVKQTGTVQLTPCCIPLWGKRNVTEEDSANPKLSVRQLKEPIKR